ncbi:MFS transporter [Candidatus Marinimicrobia bacterium MT.SAG.3]|nr:MFS transporter [Candidatus Marinimicrobia bacterium MT.SAG.3]
MANPFKSIFNIRKEEVPLSILMFSYFFLVITTFWILKPLKKTLFITFYDQTGVDILAWHMRGSQAELLAKILNMFVAFLAVIVFSWLANKYRRQMLTYIFSGFFIISYIVYSMIINGAGDVTIWTFYLFGDLFTTLMVATFFAFMNDSVSPDSAKRLYGVIGLGGVLGGVFGSTFVRIWVDELSLSNWMWVCVVIGIAIVVLAKYAGEMQNLTNSDNSTEPKEDKEKEKATTNPAFDGAKLVFKSKYLMAIAGIVGLYEIVSTLMDFQFTSTIEYYLDGPDIGRQFSTVFSITNVVSMFVQLFLTSYVMTRFGVTAALMFLPMAILVGSAGFIAFPILWVGSFLNTADNGFSYSINQSAKETLYVPTTREEKYKAKAFIDMFIQRFAKAIAVLLSLGVTILFSEYSSVRWLSVAVLLAVITWIFLIRFVGKRFDELVSDSKSE